MKTSVNSKLKVSEVFVAIQGEGPSMGKKRLFIRTSGCNLQCSFCDTKYHTQGRELNEKDLELMKKNKAWVLTGGEPTLQAKELTRLMNKYKPDIVEWETNGTFIPSESARSSSYIGEFKAIISPKEDRFQPGDAPTEPILLNDIQIPFVLKFVFVDDFSELFIKKIVRKYKIDPKDVWVMPEGASAIEQLTNMKRVWEFCLKNNYNFSSRLHVLAYDKKRGV